MILVERLPSLAVYSLPYAVSTACRSLPPAIPLSVENASVKPTRTRTTRLLSLSTATANGFSGQSYSVYFPDSLSSLSYRLPSAAITSLTLVPIRRLPADCPAIMLLPVCAAAGKPSSATPTSATPSIRITALTPSGVTATIRGHPYPPSCPGHPQFSLVYFPESSLCRLGRSESMCYNRPARAPVAQRIERWPAEPKVGGSSPLGRAIIVPLAYVVCTKPSAHVDRQTEVFHSKDGIGILPARCAVC